MQLYIWNLVYNHTIYACNWHYKHKFQNHIICTKSIYIMLLCYYKDMLFFSVGKCDQYFEWFLKFQTHQTISAWNPLQNYEFKCQPSTTSSSYSKCGTSAGPGKKKISYVFSFYNPIFFPSVCILFKKSTQSSIELLLLQFPLELCQSIVYFSDLFLF